VGPLLISASVETIGPKLAEVLAREAYKKCGTPFLLLQLLKLAISHLVQNFGLGVAYQETSFRTKIGREYGLGDHPKNMGLHTAIVEASNFKFGTQLGFGE